MELILVVDVEGLEDKERFNKHLKKEGFVLVEGEELVYTATSNTTTFSTKAYILEVVKVGLKKSGFKECKLIFQLDELPWQAYKFDHSTNDFEEAK
ncbi:hypothetical protein [Candidatus Marinarcus aquaticus]|uniref:hypothetical protein n=1 Tax=Candidatus Marinarcus aquaticus TaxID=2044504 RepID=UPI001D17765C|nr:hypothetical protein [Candidatus Marinarcus aquaticus]